MSSWAKSLSLTASNLRGNGSRASLYEQVSDWAAIVRSEIFKTFSAESCSLLRPTSSISQTTRMALIDTSQRMRMLCSASSSVG